MAYTFNFTFTLQDDPLLFDYNVQKRVQDFIDAALTQVILFHPRILS